VDLHGGRLSHGGGPNSFAIQEREQDFSTTRLEAVLFFIDLITILAWNTLRHRLILQMATSVIASFLKHIRLKFNKIQQQLMGLAQLGCAPD
jgi:hypothetical protein